MTDAGRCTINQQLRSTSRIQNNQEKRSLNHTSTGSTLIMWEELHVKFEKSFFVCLLTGPLVRIKQALTRLKQEVTQMDVRIGVVCVVSLNIYQHLMLNILECHVKF